MAGLLQFKSNEDLDLAEREVHRQTYAQDPSSIPISPLSAHIGRAWERNKRAKQSVEKRLLLCLRARQGEYDPSTQRDIDAMGGSDIYMLLTATKIRAATSWIRGCSPMRCPKGRTRAQAG